MLDFQAVFPDVLSGSWSSSKLPCIIYYYVNIQRVTKDLKGERNPIYPKSI